MVQLQIHLHQGLLHVLNVRGRVLDEALTQSQVGAQLDNRLAWAEAPAQQPVLVQLLEPLRVIDVRLPPRHLLHVAGIDQHDLEPASLEDLEDGNPVDTGGLHRDGCDADGLQPVGERVQVTTEGAEGPDRCRVTVRPDRDDVVRRPDIDAGGVRIDRRERIRRSTLGPLCHGTPPRNFPRQGRRTRTLS